MMRFKFIFIIVIFLIPNIAFSEDYRSAFFKYGVGVFKSAQDSYSETLLISGGIQKDLNNFLIHQIELGVWRDLREDLNRKSSIMANWSIGTHVDFDHIFFKSLWGVGVVTSSDSYLGGPFQFNHDFILGLRDKNGKSIGINYKHISSAGIYSPNIGRDFLSIQLDFKY